MCFFSAFFGGMEPLKWLQILRKSIRIFRVGHMLSIVR